MSKLLAKMFRSSQPTATPLTFKRNPKFKQGLPFPQHIRFHIMANSRINTFIKKEIEPVPAPK